MEQLNSIGEVVFSTPPNDRKRCFVTSVQVDKPHMNRLVSTVSCREDNGGLECSFPVVDGSQYKVGQIVWVTVSLKGD